MRPHALLVALVAVAACTSPPPADEGTALPTPGPTAESPTSPSSGSSTPPPAGPTDGDDLSPTPTATEEPSAEPFDADTRPDTSESSGDLVTLAGIRVGRHTGYDRVVLDVGGDGRPGWDVRYVDEARGQATGERVAVQGAAILEVSLTHTGYPGDTGVEFYDGPRAVAGPGGGVVQVVLDSAFEGTTQLFVGTSGEQPFRARWLDGRVVIDVAQG
jgi:hypothetical protein